MSCAAATPRPTRRWGWARSAIFCRATATARSARATTPSSSSSARKLSCRAPAIATSSIAMATEGDSGASPAPSACASSGKRSRPIGDEALGPVGLDLAPFLHDALAERRIGVPALDRRAERVDRHQHLVELWPMAVQGHRVAPRRADLAEADDAGDVLAAQRRIDHRQGEQDVLAGVGGAVLLEDQLGRHAAFHHAVLYHGAF